MFLISEFNFLYRSLPSVLPFFFLTSLLLSHRSMMSEVTRGFFMRRCLPSISLAVSVTAMFMAVIIVSMSLLSFSNRMSGGHTATANGLKPGPGKIEAIVKMPARVDAAGVRRLLGMIRYLEKFMPNLSQLTSPLRKLTHTDVEWSWG